MINLTPDGRSLSGTSNSDLVPGNQRRGMIACDSGSLDDLWTIPRSWDAIVVLTLLLLGVWLRCDGLTLKSFWYDEVMTTRRIAPSTLAQVTADLKSSPFPPLYYLILKVWTNFWGTTSGTIRALAACFSLLTMPAFYLIWLPLLGRRVAVLGLALLACNAFHIWYSHDGKMYSAVWFFATVSCGAFLNAVRGRRHHRFWLVVFGLATTCLTLTSYVGVSVIAVQGIYGLGSILIKRDERNRLLVIAAVAWVSLNPLWFWLSQVEGRSIPRDIKWIPEARWHSLGSTLVNLIATFSTGAALDLTWSSGFWGPVLILTGTLGTALAVAMVTVTFARFTHRGCGWLAPRGENLPGPAPLAAVAPEVFWFLGTWLILPIAGSFAYSVCFHSLWGVPRYLIGSAPALLILVAIGLDLVRPRSIATAALVGITMANLAVIAFDRTHETRLPWRAAAQELDRISKSFATISSQREKSESAIPGRSPRLTIVKNGWLVDMLSIEYALTEMLLYFDMSLNNQTIEKAVSKKKPFVIVAWRGPGVHFAPIPPELEDHLRSWRCVVTSSTMVYQDFYAATPSPFQPSQLDIITCYPAAP